jgi:hypothetical protein
MARPEKRKPLGRKENSPEHDPEKWMPVFREDRAPPEILSVTRFAKPRECPLCETTLLANPEKHALELLTRRVDAGFRTRSCSNVMS